MVPEPARCGVTSTDQKITPALRPVPAERPLVTHVITHLIIGGAGENTLLSCAKVDPTRFRSEAVTGARNPEGEGELFGLAESLGVRVHRVPGLAREIAPLKDGRALLALVSYLRMHRPAIVHTHSSKAGILGRLAAWLCRVPAIVHTAHGWSFSGETSARTHSLYVWAEKLAARCTDVLIVVTQEDEEKGLALGVGSSDQYRLVRSGFDLEPYRHASRSRNQVREELGIPPDASVVLFVARFAEQKDPETFLAAIEQALERVEDLYAVMVGDGPLRERTASLAAAGRLAGRVRFPGFRSDVPRFFGASDLFVLTSRWEGLPRVVPQALSAGLPVVASAVDGVREVLGSAGLGRMVPPGDVAGFADAIVESLQQRDRDELAGARRERAKEFDLTFMIRALEEIYAEALQGGVREAAVLAGRDRRGGARRPWARRHLRAPGGPRYRPTPAGESQRSAGRETTA